MANLAKLVTAEAMHWGNNATDSYHASANRDMDKQWEKLILPVLKHHQVNPDRTLELSCGHGRNSRKLLEFGAKSLTLIDVNAENIAHCKRELANVPNVSYVVNNGLDLSEIADRSQSLVYSFDSMVHFDMQIVLGYIAEFARILEPGGKFFIHHSNYSSNPGGDFQSNPHWRNYMSAGLFKHLTIKNGFTVLEQKPLDWGHPQLDCLTVAKRVIS